MASDDERIASQVVAELEKAWNAADGAAYARPYAEDADFVNVRGEHHRTRESIARGHQVIFDTIYKGSVLQCAVAGVRPIAPGVLLVHVKGALRVPAGPLAGEHNSFASLVLVQKQNEWEIAAFHNTFAV